MSLYQPNSWLPKQSEAANDCQWLSNKGEENRSFLVILKTCFGHWFSCEVLTSELGVLIVRVLSLVAVTSSHTDDFDWAIRTSWKPMIFYIFKWTSVLTIPYDRHSSNPRIHRELDGTAYTQSMGFNVPINVNTWMMTFHGQLRPTSMRNKICGGYFHYFYLSRIPFRQVKSVNQMVSTPRRTDIQFSHDQKPGSW